MNNNVKRELEKIEIPEELHDRAKKGIQHAKIELSETKESENSRGHKKQRHLVKNRNRKRYLYKRILLAAVICLIAVSTLTFTPALATIQEVYEKIFTSEHIDDEGVRNAVELGQGQLLNKTFYDEQHDINVHFDRVLVDDKETKLLLTYQSKETNLKNHYIDLFEGISSIDLYVGVEHIKSLDNVGWGSSYYDSTENKMTEALSFESIKDYVNQDIRFEIENLTIWNDTGMNSLKTKWPVEFKLKSSAVSERENVEVNKEFNFKGETYTIKRVEFSKLETRVVVTGSDTKIQIDENGMEYRIMSQLERQFLNARKISQENGYSVADSKSGVFLRSSDKRVNPIFNKGEIEGQKDEYIMVFAPVENRNDCIIEVSDEFKISLTD